MATEAEVRAMQSAIALAATPGVPRGPNPRVGCVLLDGSGRTIAEGYHRGAGSAHAEVDALRQAGERASGATAVVTLEPCAHSGRTGPCSQALVQAGVARVVYAQADPNPVAAGGAAELSRAGVEVEPGVLAEQAAALNTEWSHAVRTGRPFVTWKVASSLDGRVAAADGTSRWITGPDARADVHEWRSRVDAVLVGTGTALADDPSLTARRPDGTLGGRQPLRVVMGRRSLPPSASVRADDAGTLLLHTHDPQEALEALAERDIQHVYLEGGPTLAGAFVAAGFVDRVVAYVAAVLLGAGTPALGHAGVTTLSAAPRLFVTEATLLGDDVRIIAEPYRGDS